jgi:EAL domain-containing protein (putative c-di-GMP-specific phosphodiesterase class I)
MAETLGLRVVAEGVESRCQFEALASLNCTEAQGYLFGRPMTIDAAQALLLDATAVAHAG